MFRKYLAGKTLPVLTNPRYGFGPAMPSERIVFGARRPGFPLAHVAQASISQWLQFMHHHSIQQVVCLLPEQQLAYYPDELLKAYQRHFGQSNVCWVPIEDFTLVDTYALVNVLLPFLFRADQAQKRVVVHCSGGIGRTGHILAAWLVAKYAFSNQQAISTVRHMGRNAREAGDKRLDDLLDTCRQVFVRI